MVYVFLLQDLMIIISKLNYHYIALYILITYNIAEFNVFSVFKCKVLT